MADEDQSFQDDDDTPPTAIVISLGPPDEVPVEVPSEPGPPVHEPPPMSMPTPEPPSGEPKPAPTPEPAPVTPGNPLWDTPPPGTPGTPTGAGTPLDEGFYVWLKHHGVTPGDASQRARMGELYRNYQSLPEQDHAYYREAGRADPASHAFDLSGWAGTPGLPAYDLGRKEPPPVGPPDEVPPEGPPEEPGPPVHEPIMIGLPETERAAFRERYGYVPTEYDWEGRRTRRRRWDATRGRFV